MKKFLIAGALVFAAVGAKATALCSADLTLSAIVSGGGSCEVGDKIFSNFVYTPGVGDPDAGHVTIGATESDPGATFGLQFGSNSTSWVTNFSLSFAVTVDQTACQTLYPGTSTCFISGVQDQFQGGPAGVTNTATLVGTHVTNVGPAGGVISLNALSTAGETGQILGLNATSITASFAGSGTASFPVNQFGIAIFQGKNPVVPEPMTFSLMGAGLLGLGLMRKRIGRR